MTDRARAPTPSSPSAGEILQDLDRLLDQMAEQQRTKALAVARVKNPRLTHDDIMNPEAYPEIYADGPFNYEDGILAGIVAAQIAVRRHLKNLVRGDER